VRQIIHHVRDVGVAGSNPATPTMPTTFKPDLSQLFVSAKELGGDRVHKRVHRRVVRMVSLTRDNNGNYRARKRIPAEVKADYGRLYDVRSEEKFFRKADDKEAVVRREFNEWLADVETRIANIRAQQNGEGISLTRLQARALAGQWYDWFVGRHHSLTTSRSGSTSVTTSTR
jgi:hypothetical protein